MSSITDMEMYSGLQQANQVQLPYKCKSSLLSTSITGYRNLQSKTVSSLDLMSRYNDINKIISRSNHSPTSNEYDDKSIHVSSHYSRSKGYDTNKIISQSNHSPKSKEYDDKSIQI